ncbi:MAG: hypothetical protein JWQ71_1703 [Pedosphaera sp.]|nr:hypothetical protein [Pedosphaera sp.]
MNKISKEKRNHIIVVLVLTLGAIAGLWFGLISYQKTKLNEVSKKIDEKQKQIDKIQKVVLDANQVAAELKTSAEKVNDIESGMASGDLFSFMVSTLKKFNTPSYKVEMPQFGPPSETETVMFPNYPYKQATIAVGGRAYYYDFGKFLADLENHFPYSRVQNLVLEPGSSTGTPEEREKLTFRMEVVTLVKPNAP